MNCSTFGKNGNNILTKRTLEISGQLGVGVELKTSLPVLVKGIEGKIKDVGAGSSHSIVVTSNGVYSFGLNDEVLKFLFLLNK